MNNFLKKLFNIKLKEDECVFCKIEKDAYEKRQNDQEGCRNWMQEIGASKLYTEHVAFEDPNLVEISSSISEQLKLNKIRNYQKLYAEKQYFSS